MLGYGGVSAGLLQATGAVLRGRTIRACTLADRGMIRGAPPLLRVIMNVRVEIGEAERAQSEGNAIYEKLLPVLKQQGVKAGDLVAINIATGEFVTAETRLELLSSYKARFGQSVGWVREIEYQSN